MLIKIDLERFSLKALKKIRGDVEKAIRSFEQRRLAEARSELSAKASELGYSLDDLLGTVATRKRTPAKPKHRHPAEPELTWTGRGRAPLWMVELENNGKSRSELLIAN